MILRLWHTLFFLILFTFSSQILAQCPNFTTNATITGCTSGPGCSVCPGDNISVTVTGTSFPANGCVDFYYSTSPSFNPPAQGTFMDCAPTIGAQITPCTPCPTLYGTLIDACGTEQANEFMVMGSGGGFSVNDLSITFDPANSGGGVNSDIGAGCNWQVPNPGLVSAISSACIGGNVIGVGPGGQVPADAVVLVFTSSATNYFSYDFSAICAIAGITVCVIQNGCDRSIPAFTNNDPSNSVSRTHSISLSCGCNQTVTYNNNSLSGNDGDFVAHSPFPLPPLYLNFPCGAPIPAPPITPPTQTPETVSINWTVPPSLCNGGPYYVVGVVNPLNSGCAPVQTSVPQFDVVCPTPSITPVPICASATPFDLNTLLDQTYTGTWTSSSNPTAITPFGTLNTSGLSGNVTIQFTPTPCGTPTSSVVNITSGPSVSINPIAPVCAGTMVNLMLTFSGTGPYDFNLYENSVLTNSYTSPTSSFSIPVTVSGNTTTYAIDDIVSGGCAGLGDQITVTVSPAPTAALSLAGTGTVCAGQSPSLEVNFTGTAPFTFEYTENGSPQAPITTSDNPYTLTVTPSITSTYTLSALSSGSCAGTFAGSETISVSPAPTATIQGGSSTICQGQNENITINFTGAGPWTFDYEINSALAGTETATASPYTLNVSPGIGNNTITLSNLTTSGGTCAGTSSGSYTVNVESTPTASISGNELICVGGLGTIQIDFTGTGPYTFDYSDGSGPQGTITTADNPYFLNVSPSMTTTYTLLSLNTPSCPGTVSGNYTVDVSTSLSATVQSGQTTICAGSMASVPITFTGTAPFTFEYAIGGTSAGTITTNSTNYNLMISPGVGSHVIDLISLVDAAQCPGTVSGQFTVDVITQPNAVISGVDTICAGASSNLMITFSGPAPHTFVYAENGTNQTPITTSDNPYTLTVSASTASTYTLISAESDGCVNAVSGQAEIQISSGLTATLSGDQNYCLGSGAGADLIIDFSGDVPPYLITYRENGVIQPPINVTTNPYTLTVFPGSGTTYTLNSVSSANCTGTQSGSANVLVFTPPTADVVTTDAIFCEAQITNVEIDFTGTGPFIIDYSIDGVAQAPINTSDDPYFLPLNITQNTGFVLDSIQSVGCMGNLLDDEVNFTLLPNLNYTNFDVLCDQTAGTYTISCTLTDGATPYTLIQGAGNFSGDDFTSDPIPLGNLYSIWIADSNACDTIKLEGAANCACVTDAGSMDLTPLEACENGPGVTATFNQDSTLEVDDVFHYILHTNSGNVLGTLLATSASPSFQFIPGVTSPGVTYYISPIAGYPTVLGAVNVLDPCLSIGPGTPVTWQSAPTANVVTQNSALCPGEMTSVEIEFTGTAPFILDYSLNNVPQTSITTSDNPYLLPLTINQNTTFVLDSIRSGICTGTFVNDAVSYTVLPSLSSTNFDVTCDQTAGSYTVTFTALSGIPPYLVIQGGGGFIGNQYTSTAIPLSDPYSIWVTDGSGCDTLRFDGVANCACVTDAGTMDGTLIEACVNGGAVTAIFNQDSTLEADDDFGFFLFTDSANPLGSWISSNISPSFSFLPPLMLPNVTYYIAPIAGNDLPTGLGGSNDPCISIGTSTPVIWRSAPSANVVSPDASFCEAQMTNAEIDFTGTGPFILHYSLNGVAQASISTSDDPHFLPLTINQNTTLIVDSVSAAGCIGTIADDEVNYTVLPDLFYTNFDVLCDQNSGTYTVSCMTTNGLAPYTIVQGTGSFSGDDFTSDPIALTDPYSIWITDSNACDTIKLEGVANCNCNTNAGTMDLTPLDGCENGPIVMATFNQDSTLDANDVFYYVLHTNPGNLLGTILATSPSPSFQFISGLTAPGQTYYISPIAGDSTTMGLVNTLDPCLSVGAGTPVIWHTPPTATMVGDFNICAGESQIITIDFTGNAPFTYTYSQDTDTLSPPPVNSGNSTAINVSLNEDRTFTPITIQDLYCVGTVSGMATVDVHPEPEISNVDIICDAPTQSYIVEFDVNHDSLSSVTITGSLSGNYDTLTGHFVSGAVPWGNSYSAVVADLVWNCGLDSISGMPNCLCTTDAGTMDQTPVSLCFQDTAMLSPAVGATLEPNDTLIYILSPNAGPPAWTTLAANSEPTFAFIPGTMTTGQTYYILAVAGDTSSLDPSGVDLGDPCLSVANGTPVSWREPITAAMQDNIQICQGDTANLTIVFGGTGPFSLEYVENAIPQPTLTSTTDTFNLLVNPTLSANYSPITVTGGGCAGTVSGGAAVSVLLPPDLIEVDQICDFAAGTYQVTFKITNGDDPNPVYTVTGVSGTVVDTTFLSDPIPVTQGFSLVVSNPTGCTASLTGVSQCLCTTSAGTIQAGPLEGCSSDLLQFSHLGDFNLGANDLLRYIVFSDSTQLPSGILMTLSSPEIQFDPGILSAGQPYYVAAIAGVDDGLGNIDLTDPCLDISYVSAFSFFPEPSAMLAGDTMVCPNSDVVFEILLTGTAPFELSYTQNGGFPITLTSNTNVFAVSYMDITLDQNINLIGISDSLGCQGTAAGMATITVKDVPEAAITGDDAICPGGSAQLTLNLLNGTDFDVEISDGTNPPIQYSAINNGETFSVMPSQTTTYEITALQATGADCPGNIGGTFTVSVEPMSIAANVQQYGNFQISCAGEADGSIEWIPLGGDPTLGYTYMWNNGLTSNSAIGLDTGVYEVTISDQAFCESIGTVTLTEPDAILLDWNAENPGCVDVEFGQIILESVFGGTAPYTFSIEPWDSIMGTTVPFLWGNLEPDTYSINVLDANGCTESDTIIIFEPNSLEVDLGGDINVIYGDSVNLEAIVNYGPLTSIDWSSPGTASYADSLELSLVPFQTTSVSIVVEDTLGCISTDRVVIGVERKNRVFVPNVLQPYSNANNEILRVYGGPEVVEVEQFDIYDRWGNLIFSEEGFEPNSQTVGWDGKYNNRQAQSAVYVYVVKVRYIDGSTEVIKGDVTVTY